MSHRPRRERDLERIRRAESAARLQGRPAIDAALAQVDAAFGQAGVINAFKLRAERWLRLGPHHAAVRARFGARAHLLRGRSLDETVVLVERWWRIERKSFQIASALGRGNRLSLEVLAELRLIVRLMRFKRMQQEFREIVAEMCGEPIAEAAE